MKAAISLSVLLLAGAPAGAWAQEQAAQPHEPAASAAWTLPERVDTPVSQEGKAVKHIRYTDAGSTIDEVREGAETRSITVTPNSKMPSYNIIPDARNGQPGRRNNQGGQRVWKVINF